MYRRQVVAAQFRIVVEALRMWRGAAARATLRGIVAGLFGVPGMIRKRRTIQSQRVVSAEYMERLMVPPYEIPVEDKGI